MAKMLRRQGSNAMTDDDTKRSSPILIWGAGAIGGTVGAFLARAGHRVVFVDVVAEHVARIAAGELIIEGPIASFSSGGTAMTPQQVHGQYDLILLAVKSHHTEQAARALAPHLAADGAVVSLQNGLNELRIADIVGRERTIGAFVNFSADWLAPGRITYAARSPLTIGELDARTTPRIQALHRLLLDFEQDTHVTDNIFGYLWGKNAYATFLAVSALSNEQMPDFMQQARLQPLIYALIREVLRVAVADGVQPLGFQGYDPQAFLSGDVRAMHDSLMANRAFKQRSTKKHSGYWRDLAVRKRETDITAQLDPARERAARHGVPMPLVDRMLAQIARIERREVEQGMHLVDELLPLVPARFDPIAPAAMAPAANRAAGA
jgi:2-dehydropantoate 2-reductase